jgi:hypothetical protein
VEDSEAENMAEQMVIDMNESIEAILADPSHTKLLVRAAHTAVALMMIADKTSGMDMGTRGRLYDQAGVVLTVGITGDEGTPHLIAELIGRMLDGDAPEGPNLN